ncbi:MAG: FctA domain-containing protein [Lachnospiraceae bacterium]|nr:FctA domain-containing protein [Lachnospiraceae bacterium]
MKIRNKLFALGLSLAMVMGMGAVVSADEKTYTDATTVTITKNYELKGEGKSPAETFKVEQVGDGKVTDGDATSAPALTGISAVTYAAGAAGSENKTGTFTVTLPNYERTGVYEYTLQEVAGKTAGVTYRTKPIKLVVTVIEQSGLIRVAAVHTEQENGTKTSTFNDNTYTANSLSVSKKVTGNLGDKKKEFNFTVTFTAPTDKDWTNAITVAEGSGATDLTWDGNTATFTLSDADTVTFENVPAGVSYEVKEDSYEKDGYETTYDGSENGTMGESAVSTTVTNDKTGTVDTGINLDSLPYILILVLAAGLALAFIVSRRRRFE